MEQNSPDWQLLQAWEYSSKLAILSLENKIMSYNMFIKYFLVVPKNHSKGMVKLWLWPGLAWPGPQLEAGLCTSLQASQDMHYPTNVLYTITGMQFYRPMHCGLNQRFGCSIRAGRDFSQSSLHTCNSLLLMMLNYLSHLKDHTHSTLGHF